MQKLVRFSQIIWLAAAIGSVPTQSATIYVEGGCSLAEAITSANIDGKADVWCNAGSGADTVILTSDVTLLVRDNDANGGNGLPPISTDITVEGGGHTIKRGTSAASDFRLFQVDPPGVLRLNQVVIENGRNSFGGGCIYVHDYAMAVLDRTVLYGCNANKGGGVYVSDSYLTVIESSFLGNWASEEGCRGGAIGAYNGHLWIDDSTFESNWAFCADGLGGAVALRGRWIYSTNNTYSTSFAGSRGGAIWVDDSFLSFDTVVDLVHNTFAGNQLGTGGAGSSIARDAGTVTLVGSIVDDGAGTDCDGTVVDGGDNFGCGSPSVTNLDFLADNGGPTKTRALLDGSNAIDAAGDCDPAADQRGAPRDASCDSGAYEHAACVELVLQNEVVDTIETYSSPCRILANPDWSVAFPGDVTLRAGRTIALGEGFTVESGCGFVTEIDPGLLVP